ncbi:MAG: DUF4080 domain-containing protein [Planctomycetaceae bacterium]|nr:DUF4080 domain-containing protein [Planctomycetaceae bacterium]
MPKIVLTTINARYQHTAFGIRYLQANLGDLRAQSVILEFGLKESATEVLDAILAESPRIVGFGVYIWNVEPLTGIVAALKTLRPEITIILGGPEVSYELDDLPIATHADYIIQGEADLTCRKVCEQILAGQNPPEKVISAELPQLDQLQMPYDLYNEEDLKNRVLYVEASRGCPFTCEFCLSALEIPVRQFDVEKFLAEMQSLFDRGARWFKFVDRTFNLNIRIGKQILQFFLDRYEAGMFLHFEMIPDRLPDGLRELIAQFPPGALQFEIGIQTFNDEVSDLISRQQDNEKVVENFANLTSQTGVHIHADLIVGLPGETLESFGQGFDRLLTMSPHEIQVGILKRLKGTPIVRHDDEWEMKYATAPPYEILETKLVSFHDIQRIRRFAQLWDRTSNSGNFVETVTLLWAESSPFESFLAFSDWAVEQVGRSHAISLNRLVELMFQYLTIIKQVEGQTVAESIWRDFHRAGRHDKPKFLRQFDLPTIKDPSGQKSEIPDLPGRQARHASKLM